MTIEDASAAGASLPFGSTPGCEKDSTLKLETDHMENATIVRCQGRIVLPEEVLALSRRLTELIDENHSLVLDFSGVESMDSAGLAELMLLHMWAEGSGYPFCLAAPHPRIRHLLEITNLVAVFKIHATVEEALQARQHRLAKSA